MGIKKHGTSDNVAGLPKKVKQALARSNREEAQRQKNNAQRNGKATNQEGNRGNR